MTIHDTQTVSSSAAGGRPSERYLIPPTPLKMVRWLVRLKSEKSPDTYSKASVATVASPEVERPEAGNEPAPDPDRWCWPHSPAMNSHEIEAFMARLVRFTDKGLSTEEAGRLADKLVIRDREGDDRRLCLECAHLHGAGRWRCGNWRAAGVPAQGLARDVRAASPALKIFLIQ